MNCTAPAAISSSGCNENGEKILETKNAKKSGRKL
jgi:hypothetical protein